MQVFGSRWWPALFLFVLVTSVVQCANCCVSVFTAPIRHQPITASQYHWSHWKNDYDCPKCDTYSIPICMMGFVYWEKTVREWLGASLESVLGNHVFRHTVQHTYIHDGELDDPYPINSITKCTRDIRYIHHCPPRFCCLQKRVDGSDAIRRGKNFTQQSKQVKR